MKKIVIIFSFFLFIGISVNAQIAIVTSTVNVFSSGGGTGTAINTSTANFIGVVLTLRNSGTNYNLSDSKSNTWTRIVAFEGASNQGGVAIYYCSPCIVGSGHTFTTTSDFSGLNVFAFSGVSSSSPLDQSTGNFNNNLSSTIQPGSVTPTQNGEIALTGVVNFNGSAPTIPTGYTGFNYATATAHAGGAAYKIQSTAGAENPTWSNMNVSSNGASNIATFFAPSAGTTTNFNDLISQTW